MNVHITPTPLAFLSFMIAICVTQKKAEVTTYMYCIHKCTCTYMSGSNGQKQIKPGFKGTTQIESVVCKPALHTSVSYQLVHPQGWRADQAVGCGWGRRMGWPDAGCQDCVSSQNPWEHDAGGTCSYTYCKARWKQELSELLGKPS